MSWMQNATPRAETLNDVLIRAFGDFCFWGTGERLEVVAGWVNAVARPKAPYVMVTPVSATWHATTSRKYTRNEEDPSKGALSVRRSMSRLIQLDFYGEPAETNARIVATLLQDLTGCDFLKPYDLVPLTASEPRDMTAAIGNEQAEYRWLVETEIQPVGDLANTLVPELDFFQNVKVGLFPQE